jgi:hypothetical protein
VAWEVHTGRCDVCGRPRSRHNSRRCSRIRDEWGKAKRAATPGPGEGVESAVNNPAEKSGADAGKC